MDPQCGFYFVAFPSEVTERQELFQNFYREDRAKKQFEASRQRQRDGFTDMENADDRTCIHCGVLSIKRDLR